MKTIEERKARISGFEIPVECINLKFEYNIKCSGYHYHDYVEFLYGVDCDAKVFCDGIEYNMKSGDFVVINSGKSHKVISERAFNQYIVIKFLPQILYAAEQSVFEYKYIFPFIADTKQYKKLFKKSEVEASEIPQIITDIMREWDKKEYGYEIALRIYVSRIVLWLIRKWNEEINREINVISETAQAMSAIQKTIEYVNKNYQIATSREAARITNLSYSYFSRLFKRVMNKSFTEYVNYVRLSEAQRLLATTEKSVTEISMDVGFSTTSYFIETFRKRFGITPKEFRQVLKK